MVFGVPRSQTKSADNLSLLLDVSDVSVAMISGFGIFGVLRKTIGP